MEEKGIGIVNRTSKCLSVELRIGKEGKMIEKVVEMSAIKRKLMRRCRSSSRKGLKDVLVLRILVSQFFME